MTKKYNKAMLGILIAVLVLAAGVLIHVATYFSPSYWELDSYAYPIISMEYRHSLIIEQEDIELMIQDFPTLYATEYEWDKTYGLSLISIGDDQYISYYFPVYSALCLPAKIVLQTLNLDQRYCFIITNVVLFWIALLFVAVKLNTSRLNRILCILLMIINPAIFYVSYCSAEVFCMSFVTISLVYFSNKKYNRAAIFLTLAGMVQQMIMAIGLVYIAEFLIQIYLENRPQLWIKSWLKSWKRILSLVICFLPTFIPFIFNYLMISKGSETAGMFMTEGWASRVGAYLFDLNFGLAGYFPVLLIIFAVLTILCIRKHRYRILAYGASILALLSIMGFVDNINCGMYMYARYIIWVMPVLMVGTVYGLEQAMEEKRQAQIMLGAMVLDLAVSAGLVTINLSGGTNEIEFNRVSQIVMDHVPSLYNPHMTTFYVRSNNVFMSDRSGIPGIGVYSDSRDGSIRKVLIQATEEQKELFLSSISGDDDSIESIQKRLDSLGNDGGYYYINISPSDNINLYYNYN